VLREAAVEDEADAVALARPGAGQRARVHLEVGPRVQEAWQLALEQ
jgi:hypothetical protein